MFYKQTPVKTTGNGLAAGCQVFNRKIYGFFFYSVAKYETKIQEGTDRISHVCDIYRRKSSIKKAEVVCQAACFPGAGCSKHR